MTSLTFLAWFSLNKKGQPSCQRSANFGEEGHAHPHNEISKGVIANPSLSILISSY